MNKFNCKSSRIFLSVVLKSLLIIALTMSTPYSLQACQSAKVSWKVWLLTGLALCFKSGSLQREENRIGESAGNVSSVSDHSETLALVANQQNGGSLQYDNHGKKLVRLYCYNDYFGCQLLKTVSIKPNIAKESNVVLDLLPFRSNNFGETICQSKRADLLQIASPKSTFKKLAALCFLVSSIPGAEAGPLECAACTSIVCAGFIWNPPAFGVCVIEAATTVCLIPCTLPGI